MFLIDGEPQQHHEATLAIFKALDEDDNETGEYLVQIQDDHGDILAAIVVDCEMFRRRWALQLNEEALQATAGT